MLTTKGGPVVLSEKSLRALLAIRREGLLAQMYASLVMSRSNFEAVRDTPHGNGGPPAMPEPPAWLRVVDDAPGQAVPDRVSHGSELELASVRLTLAMSASLLIIDGPIKESIKLSSIKAEGVVSLLVQAYRLDLLTAVKPMVKALSALGHEDVLPPVESLAAMYKALAAME
jgi:predicted nucleic acid-binding protein